MEYEFRWYRNPNKQNWTVPFRLQYRTRESYETDEGQDSYIHYYPWSDWEDIPYVEEK